MNDAHAISVAQSELREGYNSGDIERILSVFDEGFTNMSDGDCSFFFGEGKQSLREQLGKLFVAYRVEMAVVIIDITVLGDFAYDWGWHKLTLTPRQGGEPVRLKMRYFQTWKRQPDGGWKISFLISNREHPPRMLADAA